MKKITIEYVDAKAEFFAKSIIKMTDTVLSYESKTGMFGSRAIYNGTKVIIEDVEGVRDWVIVAGKGTRKVYAIQEEHAVNGIHIILQDLLTQAEAEELAERIEGAINSYKF